MRTNWIWILIGTACLATLTAYFWIFNGSVSVVSQDWASFGGYVSGIMIPILTAINIWVFIRLTEAIDTNTTKRQQEEVKHQAERHNADLEFQKRKILTELRQDITNDLALVFRELNLQAMLLDKIAHLNRGMLAINSILHQKSPLFPIESEKEMYQEICDLHIVLEGLASKMYENPRENQLTQDEADEIFILSNSVLRRMQEYTINNI